MKVKNKLVSDIHKMLFIVFITLFIAIPAECKSTHKQAVSDNTKPEISVSPEKIRLGIARMTSTDIIFQGKGFTPGDSVFIKILNVQKDGKRIDIPIAEADVDPDGQFETAVDILVKVVELLRADLGMDDNFETIIIVKNKPVDTGLYTVKAVSMESDKIAECKLMIKNPSIIDRLKDWIGGLLGKIKKES